MHNNIIAYICDRCGRKAEQRADAHGQGRAPIGWTEAQVTPLNAADAQAAQTAELCDGCSNQIRRYMQPVGEPDNQTPPRQEA